MTTVHTPSHQAIAMDEMARTVTVKLVPRVDLSALRDGTPAKVSVGEVSPHRTCLDSWAALGVSPLQAAPADGKRKRVTARPPAKMFDTVEITYVTHLTRPALPPSLSNVLTRMSRNPLWSCRPHSKLGGMITRSNKFDGSYEFKGNFFKNGYIFKTMNLGMVASTGVNPTLDELARFENRSQDAETGRTAPSPAASRRLAGPTLTRHAWFDH